MLDPADAAHRRRTIVVLGLLSTCGPLSLDLHLPVVPPLAEDLAASPSAAQLSITACLLGLAAGSWWRVRCRTGSVDAGRWSPA